MQVYGTDIGIWRLTVHVSIYLAIIGYILAYKNII